MENPFRFDAEKALEVIIYIAEKAKTPDIYHVQKILYFADLGHLNSYGRFICGDSYIAMNAGPVPSGVYDIIKDVRSDRKPFYDVASKDSFNVDGNFIVPKRTANVEFFSKSDLKCLNESIAENELLSFGQLKSKSHDAAYDSADANGEISVFEMALNMEDSDALVELLEECV